MGTSGDHRVGAISRHLKRISHELARLLGGTALVVSPFKSKVCRVEVGRDGDGAFLGRGWPEFVAAQGIGVDWFVVLRHERGHVLTFKAFDTTFCLHECSRPINVVANRSATACRSRRPQFVTVLLHGFREKMVIPPEFVCNHITENGTNSRLAILLKLSAKYWRVEVEKDRSGNLFFSGGWSRFLTSNDITEGEALLLRYEGNMVFTIKVFGLDGCQKNFQNQKYYSGLQEIEQTDKNETRRSSMRLRLPLGNGSAEATTFCTYDVGPPSWIKKEINAYALKHHLPLTPTFCKAIGFLETCKITMRTSLTGGSATKSWQVCGCVYKRSSQYQLTKGWTLFCRDNGIKEGDVCTFNIIEIMLWHVDITRHS
ncbi:hypothetical protein QOZ80_2BG0180680 [Eleusine coracana subsp. coracana]|nr:hypothetical protein QOZ80_2BG0180680 [Eleusine coracana subsp. coracana]